MKKRFFFASLLALLISEQGVAACGPPECCYHPHICGKGPEIEIFSAIESVCLQAAEASVDGKIHFNSTGYPHSIQNERLVEMAQVSWADNACTIKYGDGYHH